MRLWHWLLGPAPAIAGPITRPALVPGLLRLLGVLRLLLGADSSRCKAGAAAEAVVQQE